ncbi:glycosyltransferase [Acinetobacter larvae]|uniref:Glycosyl transferase n=1 Tax=Acinetobacter larvae TaxID=1789224 RepID=A0A1B2LVP2_9GAMM|nr:glycosyltransferase [Acinetobacter larvae]AOA56998.1 glycosyl transferase [Acinetobacter larvae]
MKILYVITGLAGGGAEKVVIDLADQMQAHGHQVKIAYLKGQPILQPQNPEIGLHYLGLENPWRLWSAYRTYQQLLQSYAPDVVHAHMVHANIFSRLARILHKVPKLICTAHSTNEGGALRMLAYRLTDHWADINSHVSQRATQLFIQRKAFSTQAITVYNGIDLSAFYKQRFRPEQLTEFLPSAIIAARQQDPACKLILAVGRLNVQKDYPNLLYAIQQLKSLHSTSFQVMIAGEGEQRAAIEQLIMDLQLQDDVILLGRRQDVAALMSIADVFVLSSREEGFALVVAEAMACECYVVATDCGGVKEVMGDTGTLVAIEDSTRLAQAIADVLREDPALLSASRAAAKQRVHEQFSVQLAVQQWLRIYA